MSVKQGNRPVEQETTSLDVIGFHEYTSTINDVVAARHFVRDVLVKHGATGDMVAAAELVVEEFAVNAIRHAGTFFAVLVEGSASTIRIAVRDDSNAYPRIADHVVLSITGRGLSIVASTAEQWGVDSLGQGKEVWAILR